MSTTKGVGTRIVASQIGIQELLSVDTCPAGQESAVRGKNLLDAGTLATIGNYDCYIDVAGLSAIDIVLTPGTVTSGGTITPLIFTTYADGSTSKTASSPSAFATATKQTVSITGLRGERRVIVRIPIASGDSITAFTRAEVNGK